MHNKAYHRRVCTACALPPVVSARLTSMLLPAVARCRYWPDNPRIKLGLRPGRYGHMAGAKKLWYNYLELFEGGGAPKK